VSGAGEFRLRDPSSVAPAAPIQRARCRGYRRGHNHTCRCFRAPDARKATRLAVTRCGGDVWHPEERDQGDDSGARWRLPANSEIEDGFLVLDSRVHDASEPCETWRSFPIAIGVISARSPSTSRRAGRWHDCHSVCAAPSDRADDGKQRCAASMIGTSARATARIERGGCGLEKDRRQQKPPRSRPEQGPPGQAPLGPGRQQPTTERRCHQMATAFPTLPNRRSRQTSKQRKRKRAMATDQWLSEDRESEAKLRRTLRRCYGGMSKPRRQLRMRERDRREFQPG